MAATTTSRRAPLAAPTWGRHWNLFDSAFMCTDETCDSPDTDVSVSAALSSALRRLTSRLRRSRRRGVLGQRALRAPFHAPRPGRLRLTIAAGARKLFVGQRAVGRAGRTTISAYRGHPRGVGLPPALRVAVRLSFNWGSRRHTTRASTFLLRPP